MLDLWVKFQNKMKADEGASLVEYALILGFVLIVVLLALTAVGAETNSMVDDPNLSNALL